MSEEVYGTSTIKRKRRTQKEIADLTLALCEIVESGRPMTVRQVFYQALTKGLVPKNETQGYKAVQRTLVKLRQSEEIPYSWITDNTRYVHNYQRWGSQHDFISDIGSLYRRDYWRHSPVRVEIWLEKDALAGVLSPVVIEEWGLDLFVTRGFASITYLQSAAEQIRSYDKPTYVYILTDLDPSGISIAETVTRDLVQLSRPVQVEVQRLAVDPWQVQHWNLPTRATKGTDAKVREFEQRHGVSGSVELDAIPPDILRTLVSGAILRHADTREIETLKQVEQSERVSLLQKLKRM